MALFIVAIIIIGLLLGIAILWNQGKAKRLAKRMLQEGRIRDMTEFKQVSDTLSVTTGDLEAADLWKKLQVLKDSSPASS